MSLDGIIAGPGGDMSWLTEHIGPNPVAGEAISKIGALLIGSRTVRGDDPHRGTDKEGKPFGGGWAGRSSYSLTIPPPSQCRASRSSLTSPAASGIRLFDHPDGTNVRLERLSLSEAPQATNLWFRIVRRAAAASRRADPAAGTRSPSPVRR
jgi:hypothetical protein